MIRGRERILSIVGTMIFAAWVLYSVAIVDGAPTSPNDASGRTWPIANHGHTAYVTLWQYIPFVTPWGLALVGVAVWVFRVIRNRRQR
jgi:hypothetical protein